MKWEKKGLIFVPSGNESWSVSHAQVPVIDIVDHETWRIYFATRDKNNVSRTTFIDVEAHNPSVIKRIKSEPILSPGKPGTFDDCGVMPSWIVNYDGRKYLYYIGWNVRNTIPYHNSIGLALSSDDGETFNKYSEGPIIERNVLEPYFAGTSCVLIDNGIWKNWYLSCTGWEKHNDKMEPLYHIKYAQSFDGINWERNGDVAIDYKNSSEGGIVKASVLVEDGIYKMWYSYRNRSDYRNNINNSYRIGYAESLDGKNWIRKDEAAGIDVSKTGWDSQMIAYPHVLSIDGRKYMFYNGNGFGASGIGYAISV